MISAMNYFAKNEYRERARDYVGQGTRIERRTAQWLGVARWRTGGI